MISLLGMLASTINARGQWLTSPQAGSAVVAYISSPAATWTTLLLLLALHLCLNYLAVRAVTMRNLNRQRANLVLSHLLAHDKVLTPAQTARLEVVFERDGVLRWLGGEVLGQATIGVGIRELLGGGEGSLDLYALRELFKDEEYLLSASSRGSVVIALKRGCSARGQLKAWLQALILAKDASSVKDKDKVAVASSLARTRAVWGEFVARLASGGWAVDDAVLETGCGPRIGED